MVDQLERAFLHEIVRQCVFVDLAAEDLNNWVDTDNVDKPGGMDRVWYSVQGMLIALGNISKLLWPRVRKKTERQSSKEAKEEDERRMRRERLRDVLGVRENSSLKNVQLRNAFEHFDIELERRARRAIQPNHFADSNLGPIDRLLGFDPKYIVRNLDPGTWTLTLQDKRALKLQETLEEVAELYARAAELLAVPLPPSE